MDIHMKKNVIIPLIVILAVHTAIAHGQVVITTNPVRSPADENDGQHQVQRNFSHRDLPPINEDYFDLSTQTGGDFYFWEEGEFGSPAAGQVIAESLLSTQTLLYEFGEIDGKKSIPFRVAEHQSHYTIFAGIQSRDSITFVAPDGRVLSADDAGVKIHAFKRMLVAAVNAPEAGEWTIQLDGRGKFLVTVRR